MNKESRNNATYIWQNAIQQGKKVFAINSAGTNGYAHRKKINFNPYLTTHTKINSEQITNLSIKTKTMKLSEKKCS